MRTLEAHVSGLWARLSPAVADVRQLLRREQRAYRLVLDDVDLDIRQFDRFVAEAAMAEVDERLTLRRRALDLVRGDLLADEPYAAWTFPLRELYTERLMLLLLDLAEDCLATARPEAAVEYVEWVLEVQPTRERAHRLLVAGHYAAGEQDRALQAYARCRRVLDDELGVRPLAETERAYLAVLNHEPVDSVLPVPARPRATATPRPPTTRFARNGATTIAYQVLGDGPLDVVFAHAWFSHMEIGWEEPHYARFLRRLARHLWGSISRP